MKKWLKDNWYIFPFPVFVGLINGFTDFSDGKKMIYLLIFSILFFIMFILLERNKK